MQPGPEGKDATIYEWKTAWNYGANVSLYVEDWGSDSDYYSLLQFNLGSIPQAQKFTAHSSHCTRNNRPVAGRSACAASPATGSRAAATAAPRRGVTWNERDTGLAWTTPGGDFASEAYASTTLPAGTKDWIHWDITGLVIGWVNGNYPNHGLALVPESTSTAAYFDSSDDTDPILHPRLTVTYACECGSPCLAPQGSGNVLLVIAGGTPNATPRTSRKTVAFESWGYTVNTIDMNSGQWLITTRSASMTWCLCPGDRRRGDRGTKLTEAAIGVVSEEGGLNNKLGLATGSAWSVGSSINVTDTSHYITALFPAGPLDIYAAAMEQLTVSGTVAPGLQTLADTGGPGSLAVLDKGATITGGGTAAGRRVMLPLGREPRFNWDYLNGNGRLLVQRALQWGTGSFGGAPALTYRDEFSNRNCNAADYTGSDGSLDWSPWDWVEGSDDNTSCGGNLGVLEDPIVTDPGNYRLILGNPGNSMTRAMDLSAFAAAWLSFDYRRDNLKISDEIKLEFWDDAGGSWVELDRIPGPATDAVYQRCQL